MADELPGSALVYMTNPKLPDHEPQRTSADAYTDLWKAKGWKLCDAEGNEVRSLQKASVDYVADDKDAATAASGQGA